MFFIYLEPVVETVVSNDVTESSTITTTATKIDRATSPIPGCSHCKEYLYLTNNFLKLTFLDTSYLTFFSCESINKCFAK